jgi:AcrR family transcriptional regulator
VYVSTVPKLWTDSIEAHRRAVRDAALDTTAGLVAQHGLRSLTMSQIAQETGIGRATLYKYFPDVESILVAWHKRQITAHLDMLRSLAERETDPRQRLVAVLEAYALIQYEHNATDPGAALHGMEHVKHAEQHLQAFVRELVADAADAGAVRSDVAPDELTRYCLHALTAATSAESTAQVGRLVEVTVAGLREP